MHLRSAETTDPTRSKHKSCVKRNSARWHSSKQMKSQILSLVVIASLILLQPVAVLAVAYTVTMQADKQNYSASDTLHLTGSIAPPPGPGTSILLTVQNPSGKKVYVVPVNVNGTTGSFSKNMVLGGTSSWVDGRYSINGTWALKPPPSPVYFAVVSFNYTVVPVTTTTTATTSATSTTTTSTTTTSSTTSTTTTNSTSSSTSTSSTSSTTTQSPTSTTSTTARSTSGGGAGILSTINLLGIGGVGVAVVVAAYLLRRRAR